MSEVKETKVTETGTTTVSKEEYEAVKAELAKAKEAYSDLVAAFNKLLQEYNELHVALLLKK